MSRSPDDALAASPALRELALLARSRLKRYSDLERLVRGE